MVVGGAMVRDGSLLAAQRAHPAQIAGKWELPGGRVEPGELEPAALRRELSEELEVDTVVGDRVGGDVPLPGGRVLRIYAVRLPDGVVPHAVQHQALRWLPAEQLDAVDWLPADRVLLPALRSLLDGW
ncbi:MAG: (deoxy)nucleoside triphosphate pyrophosphohydrolase [Thermocrispum sp.]